MEVLVRLCRSKAPGGLHGVPSRGPHQSPGAGVTSTEPGGTRVGWAVLWRAELWHGQAAVPSGYRLPRGPRGPLSPYLPSAWCLVAAFISLRENSHPVGHGCLFSSSLLPPASSFSYLSPSLLSFSIPSSAFHSISFPAASSRLDLPGSAHLPSPRPPCLGTAVPGPSHPPAPFPGCRSPWDAASGSACSGITSHPSFPSRCRTGVSAGFSTAPSMGRVSHSAVQGVLCWGRGPEMGQVTTSHPCPLGLRHVHQFRDKPNVCNNQSVLGTSGVFLPVLSQDSGLFMVQLFRFIFCCRFPNRQHLLALSQLTFAPCWWLGCWGGSFLSPHGIISTPPPAAPHFATGPGTGGTSRAGTRGKGPPRRDFCACECSGGGSDSSGLLHEERVVQTA